MNSHEILRTAIKLLGLVLVIYTVIEGLRYFPMMLDLIENSDGTIKTTSQIAAVAIPITIGLMLWFFPAPVASTIIRDDLEVASKDELLAGIENIGIRLLGMYLLYHGISDLVANYVSYSQALNMFGEQIKFSGKERFTASFIATGVEIFLSLILILGAASISSLLRKIRYAT